MVFNATFNNMSVMTVSFIGGESTDMQNITDKLYHIMLYTLP